MQLNPLHCLDSYKLGHREQYPVGTTMVYSNFTPRSSHHCPVPADLYDGTVVNFGLQHFIKEHLIEGWNQGFFGWNKGAAVSRYRRRVENYLQTDNVPTKHIEDLHDLGYLPIRIKALPEGTRSPVKVPVLVIYNTKPEFFWLTNLLETVLSNSLWKPMTVATIAYHYRKLLNYYAYLTGTDPSFVDFQAHDFSCRGMSGMHDAALCGAAHLTSFAGSDTVLSTDLLEYYYHADSSKELVSSSVPAMEHSVACAGGEDNELETFRRIITEVYPSGIVSLIADTWSFFDAITKHARDLKPEIMARNGKTVWRPDSGDPVKIICGDPDGETPEEKKGACELLWEIFGGTMTPKGYKLLDPHVGLIYGDSITLPIARQILAGLERKGFASGNIVLGVGSFSYQFLTRDSLGFAMKSTYCEINGEPRMIHKNPKTDSGVKRSLKGLIAVYNVGGRLIAFDQQPGINMEADCLREVFHNGELLIDEDFTTIRNRLRK